MTTWQRRQWLGTLGAVGGLGGLGLGSKPARAAQLPMQHFLDASLLSGAALSPDGRALLTRRRVQGRYNLVVMDLESGSSKLLTSYRRVDVSGPIWLNNQRILYGLSSRITDVGYAKPGLFSVNRDGTEPRSPNDAEVGASREDTSSLQFVGRGARAGQNLVIAAEAEARGRHQVLYRFNLMSGRKERLSGGAPGLVTEWALDLQDRPRACVTMTKELQSTFWVRPKPGGDWVALRRWSVEEPAVSLEGVDADEQLYVLHTPPGQNEQVLSRIDLAQAAWESEPLVAVKGYDVEPGAVRLDAQGRLQSIRFEADRPGVIHADEKLDALQQLMEREFPDRIVTLSPDDAVQRVLVSVWGDSDPGRHFLYESEGAKLRAVGASRPWIEPERMARTRFLRYAARDGLSIPAQLTLPPGAKAGQKHPLLVLHYGGPHVRAIRWGFDPMVQFLASRGYAVFMPAPRMSTGWGWRHHKAGWKQWGLAMQDDVTDGVLHLVKEGVADRDRLALMGASYGGYLTMMGLAKNPELWRCGVNWVGVTDIEHKFISWVDYAGSDFAENLMPLMVGDPVKDLAQMRQTSPVRRAAEIQAPVLMAYGGEDQRVPIVNGERMRDALAAAGKRYEWVVYPNEGHGFRAPEAMKDFWSRIERFLGEHMAPR